MVQDHVERVRLAVLDLCEPLHDAFTLAEQRRKSAFECLGDSKDYRWLGTHAVRAFAHHRLSQLAKDLGRWKLVGNHARNGELWLSDTNYQVRILHCLDDGTVPAPGSNLARKAFFCNVPLTGTIPLFGDPRDKLLGLWRIDPETAAPLFRMVRPIGVWRWGERHLTDLDFPLPPTADELSNMQFVPTDEGLGLSLPNEEGEADDDADGVTG